MLSMQKHGRSGITDRKKSAGQGGQHRHKREKEFDKETYGMFVYYGQVSVKFTVQSSHLSRVCACC